MKQIIRIFSSILIVIAGIIPQISHAQDYNKDLSIAPGAVNAPSSIISGETVRIYTTVANSSNQDLFGVVKYYDENRQSFIGTDQPVSVLAGKTDDVFTDWKAGTIGNHPISVRVIPWNEEGDDPSNNKITKVIYVDIDSDGDGISNRADSDDDNDGVSDAEDDFPLDPNESKDTDGDGIGNNADTDDDNDGIPDIEDAFPLDIKESVDTDGDGIGDNSDAFPNNSNESIDTDNDGLGDNNDPNNSNHGPIPQIETEKTIVSVNKIVGFNALRSRDPDGEVTSYEWDFGDGTKDIGVIVDHIFEDTGSYKVTLLVTDNKDEQREQTLEIKVIYRWQTIVLIAATGLLILLLLIPLLFSKRKKEKKPSAKRKKGLPKRKK